MNVTPGSDAAPGPAPPPRGRASYHNPDRKSTRLNSSHSQISYADFCLKKNEIRLRGQTSELMDALKQLALRYGILTEYTSYLVQEPSVVLRRQAENRVMQAPAAAPAEQAGAASVEKAARDRSMTESMHLDAVVVTAGGGGSLGGKRPAASGNHPTPTDRGRPLLLPG